MPLVDAAAADDDPTRQTDYTRVGRGIENAF